MKTEVGKFRTSVDISANGNDNEDASSNNIVLTIKETKLSVHVATCSVKDNQILSKLLMKGFGRSFYSN